jgi:hypothetical protein
LQGWGKRLGFSLRPAAKKDQPEIRKLVLAGGINPSGLDWQRFFVAEDQAGKVIGCAQLKPHRDGSVELASLVVVEDPLYEKFGFTTLGEEEMPKYFRRVSKLFGKIEPFRKGKETLLVMRKLQGESGS